MTLKLYAHPFSSYSQKVLIALYENGTPFDWRTLSPDDPRTTEEFAALWPIKRFPLLVDGERVVTARGTTSASCPEPVAASPKNAWV